MGTRISPRPWSIGLVLLLLAIHGAIELAGGATKQTTLYQFFGLQSTGLTHGRAWQILSYGLLHASWVHVGLNSAALFFAAARVEFILGAAQMVRCFVLGVLAGGWFHLWLGAAGTDVLVGASGGVFAMILLLVSLSPESRLWPIPISGRSLGLGLLISSLLLALFNPKLGLPGFMKIGTPLTALGLGEIFAMGHACHLGGALAGTALGAWTLRKRATLRQLQRKRRANDRRMAP